MKKDMSLEGLRWSCDSGSALYDTPPNGRSRTGWGGRFVECSLSSNDSAKILQFPDTTKFQRVIRRDFQHAFNPKPVKCYNSH